MNKYYHGRTNDRPYYGKQIYVTSDQEYAKLYAGSSGQLYECTLNCEFSDIFSIQNSEHQKLIIKYFGQELFNKVFRKNQEIDWAESGYFSSDVFEDLETFLKEHNFKGVYFQERTSIISILIFDQKNVNLKPI